ncbi:MAG: type VI secretion system protein TssL [Rhizobiales bacterium]|nr:type VI secretion system protein TssL [Hyphomicrobiales bacterium]
MSNKDDPFGAFGDNGGERTVIRPNPAGRRPAMPPAPPGGAPRPQAPPGYPPQPANMPPPGPSYQPVAPNYGAPPSNPNAQPGAPGSDDWVRTQETPPQYQGHAPLPEISFDELVTPHDNPIMRAAGPLLMLLGRLRVALLRASFAKLMGEVADAVEFFEKEIRSAGVAEDQAKTAKYILCATADDIVQNIPTEDRHVWTQYSMLSRFFGERLGGERFFEMLDRAQMDPTNSYPVLELMYTSLALGFQGKYRHSPSGAVDLQRIQRNLYEILRRVRPRVELDLSPNWKGQALAAAASRYRVPMWVVFGVAGLGLAGLFFVLRALLGGSADAATEAVRTMHSGGKIDIQRRVYQPPPPPPPPPPNVITQLQRIRNALAAEIQAGEVNADQDATKIYIRVGDKVLFQSGQATVIDQFKPIATRIAEVLNREPGAINVVGHTDNIKLNRTSRFKDNFELSVERAKAVAAVMKSKIADPSRLEVSGKADQQPVADNATPQGRALNRRVDLTLNRTGD